jgi:aconitate hydratase
MANDPFGARTTLRTGSGDVELYSLKTLDESVDGDVFSLPFSTRVMLESLLRNAGGKFVSKEDVEALAAWPESVGGELAYLPARVVMQDFTGVPAVVDLAAMRSAMERVGGDPGKINPLVPTDLVIDHSVQVDAFGTPAALRFNAEREFERNRERYEFLKWGQQTFDNFSVVPPATGIIHQVNLEYLAKGVIVKDGVAMPDTLVGTDSHTTMINGLGVLGWGVGGIEAEAVTLGQPYYMLVPEVIGFKLTGALLEGVTATDLVLTVTQMLRSHGVVGKFVEFYGEGLSKLSLPDRATIANMSPEFGATCTFFPVDTETLRYLRGTGRDEELVELVEDYSKEQGLWRTDETPEPRFSEILDLELDSVEASLAGPRRPTTCNPPSGRRWPRWCIPTIRSWATVTRTPTTTPTKNPSPRAIPRTPTYQSHAAGPTRPKGRRAARSPRVRATPQTIPSLSPRATRLQGSQALPMRVEVIPQPAASPRTASPRPSLGAPSRSR